MYLSKVIIARAWSRDLYQLHQGLWHLFPNRPDAARDFLFHVEKRNTPEGCHVLLQSAQMPVSTAVATVIKTKQVEFQLQVGVPLYFRLRANPIKTILDNQKRLDSKGNIKRCRVPLIKEAEQIAWLQRKWAMRRALKMCIPYRNGHSIFLVMVKVERFKRFALKG